MANLATARFHFLPVFLCLIFCSAISFAEDFSSVSLNNMTPPKVEILYPEAPTAEGTLVSVEVIIPDGWHVNANVPADKFLKPSTIKIEARGIEFGEAIWPEPITEYSEALDLENKVFKGAFEILVPVKKIAADYDTSTTNVDFGYQACSQICLAPQTVHASMQLRALSPASLQSRSEPAPLTDPKKKSDEPLAILLGFAFLGGLILNLMPCVLPVLFLKLFHLVKNSGDTKGRLWAKTLSLALGILISFWILALIISLIKAGSGQAGWGFQFQNPGFVAFMVVLLSAFAMNLFGVFELFLPGAALTRMDSATRKEGLAGSFASGILMVLLSTPCSAPFLGTAMGFAFTQSSQTLFLFFTVAALGLAFPYILAASFPGILKIFPKPGPWMVKFQKFLGFFLLGTAVWLVWVAYRMTGAVGAWTIGAFGLIALILSVLFGKFVRPDKPFIREPISLLGIIAILLAGWFLIGKPTISHAIEKRALVLAEETLGSDGWYRFSPSTFEALASEGRPIFIDVTADWCLTCKTNEAAVLSRDDVQKILSDANAILIRADYTLENPDITKLLQTLGKSGVPAYAVYRSGEWKVLSELLTADAIAEALK